MIFGSRQSGGKMLRKLIALVAFCAVFIVQIGCSGCSGSKITPVPNPAVITDTNMCEPACKHLRELHCPQGEPLSDGTSCETVCVNTQKHGVWLNPTCVITLKTCEQLEPVCAESHSLE